MIWGWGLAFGKLQDSQKALKKETPDFPREDRTSAWRCYRQGGNNEFSFKLKQGQAGFDIKKCDIKRSG
jgi:hypothetical protein